MATGYQGNMNIRTNLVPGATLFNHEVTGGDPILEDGLEITTVIPNIRLTKVAVYTIEMCFADAGTFSVIMSNGTDEVEGYIKSCQPLLSNEMFLFTKVMPEGWTLNFSYSVDTTMNWIITTVHGGIY